MALASVCTPFRDSICFRKSVLAHLKFLFPFVGRSLTNVCIRGEGAELLNFTVYLGLISSRMGANGNVLRNLNVEVKRAKLLTDFSAKTVTSWMSNAQNEKETLKIVQTDCN
jgi:hypothetical protein